MRFSNAWNWLRRNVLNIIRKRAEVWGDTWVELDLQDIASVIKMKSFRLKKAITDQNWDDVSECIRDLTAYIIFMTERLVEANLI